MLTATRAGSNSRTGPSGSPTDLRYARPGSLRRVAARSSRARCREMELSSYWPEHQPTRQRPSSSSQKERRLREGADNGGGFWCRGERPTALQPSRPAFSLPHQAPKQAHRHPTASKPKRPPALDGLENTIRQKRPLETPGRAFLSPAQVPSRGLSPSTLPPMSIVRKLARQDKRGNVSRASAGARLLMESHDDSRVHKTNRPKLSGRWHATARNRENRNGRSRGRPFRYKHSGGSRADEQARFKSLRSDRSWSPSRHESLAEAPQTGTHKRHRARALLGEGFP